MSHSNDASLCLTYKEFHGVPYQQVTMIGVWFGLLRQTSGLMSQSDDALLCLRCKEFHKVPYQRVTTIMRLCGIFTEYRTTSLRRRVHGSASSLRPRARLRPVGGSVSPEGLRVTCFTATTHRNIDHHMGHQRFHRPLYQ